MLCPLCKNNPIIAGVSPTWGYKNKWFHICYGCVGMFRVNEPKIGVLELYLESSFAESMTFWEFVNRLGDKDDCLQDSSNRG